MSSPAPAAPRRRHLMDPAHPVRPVNDRSLTQVQRYVMSTLAVFTALHMAAGLIFAAHESAEGATAARAGLSVIAGAFTLLGVIGARAIHRRTPATWWLLAAPATTVVGLWLTLR